MKELMIIYGIIGIGLILIYSLTIYIIFGVSCKRYSMQNTEPQFNISPAACKYIQSSGKAWSDFNLLYTTLISLAVKGMLKIREHDKLFEIIQTENANPPELLEEESQLYKELFARGDTVELKPFENYNLFNAILLNISNIFLRRYGSCFVLNGYLPYGGIIIALASLYLMFRSDFEPMLIFVTIVLIAIEGWTKAFIQTLYQIQRYKFRYLKSDSLIFMIFIGIVLAVIALILFLSDVSWMEIWPYIIIILLLYNIFVYVCLPISTPKTDCREFFCHISSYRRYMLSRNVRNTVATMSRDEALMNFYKYLPYAVAFKIENEWALLHQGNVGNAYALPEWYIGDNYKVNNPIEFAYTIRLFLFEDIRKSAEPFQLQP